ncbi:MAG: Lhr family helicase, partial [Longimicrobiales bacterium]
ADRRAARFVPAPGAATCWIAVERVPEARTLWPDAVFAPVLEVPALLEREWIREDAAREIVRSRTEVGGPVVAAELAQLLTLDVSLVDGALLALEAEGRVLRGRFTPDLDQVEWCDRRLLARIHRYTLNRLRAEISPVTVAEYMRFLFRWQRVDADHRARGIEGLAAVIELLDGCEANAGAWEQHVLPARVDRYDPQWLDTLCMSGRVAWGRRSLPADSAARPARGPRPVRSSPVALFKREHAALWIDDDGADAALARVGSEAQQVHEWLAQRGASFFHEIVAGARMLPTQVERALGELVAHALAAADGFAGLRALLTPERKRPRRALRRGGVAPAYGIESAGRWFALRRATREAATDRGAADRNRSSLEAGHDGAPDGAGRTHTAPRAAALAHQADLEAYARALLRRWGVVFRRVLARETGAPPWRELVLVYRRLEARGEIRGGRFVAGPHGEQFALPEAVATLRAVRREPAAGALVVISGADPLNLIGLVTPETERVPALSRNRIAFRDGVPIAARVDGALRRLAAHEPFDDDALTGLLARGRLASPARPLARTEERIERWRARRKPSIIADPPA